MTRVCKEKIDCNVIIDSQLIIIAPGMLVEFVSLCLKVLKLSFNILV
jgi:hypothetical protein